METGKSGSPDPDAIPGPSGLGREMDSSPRSQSTCKPTFLHPGENAGARRRVRFDTGPYAGRKEATFLQKLRCRETGGVVRSSASGNPRDPQERFFNRLPGRLAFCLRDTIPDSAIYAGHIFLGFSKCGQFLLSYTQTEADIDLMSLVSTHLNYHYRLHWWLFVPYKRAKKVAEITLFNNAAGNLHLSFCQWPKDMSKVLVFGCQVSENDETFSSGCSSARSCYITVTAVPSLQACKDCLRVANSYEEDEMAEQWNSCVRLSCLEHGMTVHTSFDLVSPYPKFEPRVSLKRDSGVVINSGNLLHYLHFDLETLKCQESSKDQDAPNQEVGCRIPLSSPSTSRQFPMGWSELRISVSEFSQQHPLFSPTHSQSSPRPTAAGIASDSDCESEASSYSKHRKRRSYPMNPERLDRVAEFVEQLSPPCTSAGGTKRFKRVMVYAADSEAKEEDKRIAADKVYELTDENFDEGVQEKLSTFRKKRLADKKYEFTDEDSENITPMKRTLRSTSSEAKVLKPIYSNQKDKEVCENLSNLVPVPELLSPGGITKKDQKNAGCSPRPSESGQSQPLKFHAKFTRRYIEMDDEMVSVISGIEFDDDGVDVGCRVGGGYHSVLPLEVHGTAYREMTMISNTKAEKLNTKAIKVQQNSLDIELFCHDMAQKLCAAAGKKYWFCNDYDVEIVDMDPESGEIICVAVVLVTATFVTQRVSQSAQQVSMISSLQRHLHQGTFKFCWNMDSGHCQLIDSEPLQELFKEPHGNWHPARNISLQLQKHWGVMGPNSGAGNIRSFTNDSVILGTSLKTIVDTDHLVAIILDDLP